MENLELVLNEIRETRTDIKQIDKKVSAMEATINGDLGIITRMKEHEKKSGDLIKEIDDRLEKIENYIIKQQVYVSVIAALVGLLASLVPKLVQWLFKL